MLAQSQTRYPSAAQSRRVRIGLVAAFLLAAGQGGHSSAQAKDVRAIPGLEAGSKPGEGFDCRRSLSRQILLTLHGGNKKTEAAVASGLKWLATHQMADGGWNFNHLLAPGAGGKGSDPGNLQTARNAATAMALLPFLGAGQTHKSGKYKTPVRKGLYFLVKQMRVSPQGGSLHEAGGMMYSHGLASIVLCEAYGMTKDEALGKPAQQAIDFIVHAQDPVGGGWRYMPRQAGDTSVFGWQMAALKAGKMGKLKVPKDTFDKARGFLDRVQADGGTRYGYTTPGNGMATRAIGLLYRTELGWKKDNPTLQRGVRWIGQKGVSTNNLYYNYYATQLMHRVGGQPWKRWNAAMRDHLLDNQIKTPDDPETGSWFFAPGGVGAQRGGRLYCTSLALLILEAYYRYQAG